MSDSEHSDDAGPSTVGAGVDADIDLDRHPGLRMSPRGHPEGRKNAVDSKSAAAMSATFAKKHQSQMVRKASGRLDSAAAPQLPPTIIVSDLVQWQEGYGARRQWPRLTPQTSIAVELTHEGGAAANHGRPQEHTCQYCGDTMTTVVLHKRGILTYLLMGGICLAGYVHTRRASSSCPPPRFACPLHQPTPTFFVNAARRDSHDTCVRRVCVPECAEGSWAAASFRCALIVPVTCTTTAAPADERWVSRRACERDRNERAGDTWLDIVQRQGFSLQR